MEAFNLAGAMAIRDIAFICTLPYYPTLIILLIRSIGIDLKRFGFGEDREFLEIDEKDREEVEVEVSFDKERVFRKIKNKLRVGKYFFLEHKYSLSAVFIVIFLILVYNIYHFFYVENKVYAMNEQMTANYYNIIVENTYITDKDYTGHLISNQHKYYIILDVKIQNLLATSRKFDIENFFLFVDEKKYVPTTRYNQSFVDMGNLYTGKEIDAKAIVNYQLIYEIDKPKTDTNFMITYQDLTSDKKKSIKVKIKVRDISTFIVKDTKQLPEMLTIPLNLEEKKEFSFATAQIVDSAKYTYEKCYVLDCPILEGTVTAPTGKTIMYLRGDYGEDSTMYFLAFLRKYGMIQYKIGEETYQESVMSAVKGIYRGNHLYLLVDEKVKQASEIYLYFTVRTYQYFYKIKGEI